MDLQDPFSSPIWWLMTISVCVTGTLLGWYIIPRIITSIINRRNK